MYNFLIVLLDSTNKLQFKRLYSKISQQLLNSELNAQVEIMSFFRCPLFASMRALLTLKAILLHHTPLVKKIHGLLSMSSCIVFPCFKISGLVTQLASSIR
jgi:hypothetical protein